MKMCQICGKMIMAAMQMIVLATADDISWQCAAHMVSDQCCTGSEAKVNLCLQLSSEILYPGNRNAMTDFISSTTLTQKKHFAAIMFTLSISRRCTFACCL